MSAPTPSTEPTPAFDPARSTDTGPATGPSWVEDYPRRSLRRIRDAATVDAAQAQAVTEVVILLHSIRRILMWTAVIIPMIVVALGIAFMVVVSSTGTGSTTCGIYSSRC